MAHVPTKENIGPVLVWLTAVLDIFAVLLTALRLWIRRRHHKLGIDDWFIVIALVIANIRMIFQILQSFHGNGRHRYWLTDEQYTICAKWGWYAQLCLFGANCFCKLSICLLILRIKETPFLKRGLWAVMGGLILTNGTFIIIELAQCSPVNAYWRGESDKCWTPRARVYTAYIAVGYGVVIDILLSLLPANIVWHLQMPLKKKVLVSSLMSLGLVATGFGIARAAALGIDTNDLTWDYCVVAIWSNLELWLAIICANLALGRSMIFHFLGRASPDDDTATHRSPYDYRGNTTYHSNVVASRKTNKRNFFGFNTDATHKDGKSQDQTMWSERRPSSTQSITASDIPLDSYVKKVEVYQRDDAQSHHSEHLDDDVTYHKPYNAM